jgi:hypothetical protein
MHRTALSSTALSCLVALLAACGNGNATVDSGTPSGMDSGLPPTDSAVPGCTTEGPENTAAACADSCDNDSDDFADCDDFGCCGLVTCGPTTACGMRDGGPPRDAQRPMECETMAPEDNAAACANGCDDDGNGFADCNDFDCCGEVECGAGTACGDRTPTDAGPVMSCDAAAGEENTVAACSDGCSNDGDSFVDCEDRDCCGVRTDCPTGTFCGDREPPGMRCDGAIIEENTAAACMDGCSNDDDTFVDCNDADCCSVRTDCGASTYCGRPRVDAGACTASSEDTVEACSDGCSNDGDRFVDCDDFDCCDVVTCGADTACGMRDAD